MSAWYNEIDPFAAAWLRELVRAGAIAPGDVDERDIRDVRPVDLLGYSQLHFFAGIGTWSYALRRAEWPDDRPVWTGSCPCQPFSAAGDRTGFDDERHLWPAWFHLIEQLGPAVVFGEQVASKDGLAWLDLVQADLEASHYACGALDSCSAGVGAPHIRQRLWLAAERLGDPRLARLEGHPRHGDRVGQRRWVAPLAARSLAEAGGAGRLADAGRLVGAPQRAEAAALGDSSGVPWGLPVDVAAPHGADRRLADAGGNRLDDEQGVGSEQASPWVGRHQPVDGGGGRRLADADPARRAVLPAPWLHAHGPSRYDDDRRREPRRLADGADPRRARQLGRLGGADGRSAPEPGRLHDAGGLADSGGARVRDRGRRADAGAPQGAAGEGLQRQRLRHDAGHDSGGAGARPGPTNGFWAAADWIFCRDARWRPIEPESFPLAHGVAGRVGRLRGYGNAINAEAAAHFIKSYLTRGEAHERGLEIEQLRAG